MELIARHFECHPTSSSANAFLSKLVTGLGDVEFTGRVGAKNSGQCDSDLDARIADRLCQIADVESVETAMPGIKKKCDFSFRFRGRTVVVEVEKANWEKVLYDFLKAHMYFASGAHFVVVFVPKNYVHSGKSPKKTFHQAKQRYDHCVEFGFGSLENLGRILLVGYEVALRDGRLFTPALRTQFIEEARKLRLTD
jgi:hypothetical protein